MATIFGILLLVLGILVSIGLHEVGHMVPAKKFGVRVSQYMIGFGPTLWSKVRGETEYGIKAIPLGGYVRLIGMYPTHEAVNAPEAGPTAPALQRMMSDARTESASEIRPGEDHRAFYRLKTWQKLLVMLGGPFMNLILAFVLFAISFAGIGTMTQTTTVASVSQCVPISEETLDGSCVAESVAAPAAEAGIAVGEKIVAIAGEELDSWIELTEVVAARPGETVDVVVRSGETERTITVTLGARELADGTQGGYLGVGSAWEMQRMGVLEVPGLLWETTAATLGVIVKLPVELWNVAGDLFSNEPRDGSSVISIIGVGQVAGGITSVEFEGYGFAARTADFLNLLAALNIALFAFNLIPLVPLDGGHVVGALWEGGRRKLARVRGRQDPGPSDTAKMVPVAYVVFFLLLGMGLLLMTADVLRPVF